MNYEQTDTQLNTLINNIARTFHVSIIDMKSDHKGHNAVACRAIYFHEALNITKRKGKIGHKVNRDMPTVKYWLRIIKNESMFRAALRKWEDFQEIKNNV